ncbi:MAG: peptide deformylase [Candidatus Marinimicrobia bacterium]|nr:peptide deformylase [Candidatus Neomarinimicrobiota bacterium]
MYNDDGVGLSANQVGVDKRFFIMGEAAFEGARPDAVCHFNPVTPHASEEKWDYEEGCLSVPGIREEVERPLTITVRYMDIKGKEHEETLSDLPARVFQHEFDHINGVFFVAGTHHCTAI